MNVKKDNVILNLLFGFFAGLLDMMRTGNAKVDVIITTVFSVSLAFAVLGWIVPAGVEGALTLYHLILGSIQELVSGVLSLFTDGKDFIDGEVLNTELIETPTPVPSGDIPVG